MTSQPATVAFHVGAHKTATTHLQKSLKRATVPLAEAGVRYYGPENFRLPGRTIHALFGLRDSQSDGTARRSGAEQLALLRKDAQRLVISEENFIGALNSPKGVALRKRYKSADTRLDAFTRAIGQPVDVYLSIRRPTAFLSSAYCQMLLGGQVRPLGVYLRRNPVASVDWEDLVRRIRAVPGVGQLVVWRYEDYHAVFPQIVAGLVGDEQAPLVADLGRSFNRGLSATAVAEVLHRGATDGIATTANAARDLLPVEAGYPPFDAFTPAEHAMSDARYGAQVDAIAAMEGVTLLQPPPA